MSAASGLVAASLVAAAGLDLIGAAGSGAGIPLSAIALTADVSPSTPATPPRLAWGSGTQVVGNVVLYGPTDAAPAVAAPGHVKVVVVGDSYTSGEGSSSNTYRPVTVTTYDQTYGNNPPVVEQMTDPAHQSSTAPALQAIQQMAANHPDTVFDVVFAPVSGATIDSMSQPTRPGTPFEQPPQLDAVKGADIVLLGAGGNDAQFSTAVRSALDPFSSTQTAVGTLTNLTDNAGSPDFRDKLATFYDQVSANAAPGATIITYGYPQVLPSQYPQPAMPPPEAYTLPDGVPVGAVTGNLTAAPFTFSLLNDQTLPKLNQLGAAVGDQISAATQIAQSRHPDQQWVNVDNSQALDGHWLGTAPEGMNGYKLGGLFFQSAYQEQYHPNDLGYTLMARPLVEPLDAAVRGQLQSRTAPPPSTPDPNTAPTTAEPNPAPAAPDPNSAVDPNATALAPDPDGGTAAPDPNATPMAEDPNGNAPTPDPNAAVDPNAPAPTPDPNAAAPAPDPPVDPIVDPITAADPGYLDPGAASTDPSSASSTDPTVGFEPSGFSLSGGVSSG